jgi:3-keto-5-aminohexanoate cleavage enzyme
MNRTGNGTVIITCALTGGIHGKEANPNLPEQPDEIVEQGVEAWRAGAAILHVHARNPDGSNTMDQAIYSELHERLCAETDAVPRSRDVFAQHGTLELLHPG